MKLSGEALMGDQPYGIDPAVATRIAQDIAEIQSLGVQTAIVIGGGNIFRGLAASARGMDRSTGDYMGMLATVINALALQDALEHAGVPTRVLTAIEMRAVAEPFIRRRAVRHLEKGRVVVFAAGTGNPYFTTDTAAALRAMEMKAQIILKATKVDGIYTADPVKHPDATRYEKISYLQVLQERLQVMDATAISLCMDNKLPILVFNLKTPGNIKRVVMGETVGTSSPPDTRVSQMDVNDLKGLFAEIKKRMDGQIEFVRKELAGVRTGRASTDMLQGVQVEAYGSKMPLNQVASLSIPEPALIVAAPFDPSLMPAIERAVRLSDLGLNPASDGKVLRIPIPSLTEERRKELSRHVHKQAEEGRNHVRVVRREANDKLKKLLKDHKISEDDEKRALDEVQKVTDAHIKMIDDLQKKKDQELLGK